MLILGVEWNVLGLFDLGLWLAYTDRVVNLMRPTCCTMTAVVFVLLYEDLYIVHK